MTNSNPVRAHEGVLPTLAEGVFIDTSAVVIGNVTIGKDSSVWPCAVIRGDMHTITIGKRVSIQDNATLHITHASEFNSKGYPLTIGDDVTIGHNACLHGCTLGSRVLIGIGAVVLDGTVIPDDVMIAAGALVPPNKTLESGYLYLGNPAKKARALTDKEKAFFTYSAGNYAALKETYLQMFN